MCYAVTDLNFWSICRCVLLYLFYSYTFKVSPNSSLSIAFDTDSNLKNTEIVQSVINNSIDDQSTKSSKNRAQGSCLRILDCKLVVSYDMWSYDMGIHDGMVRQGIVRHGIWEWSWLRSFWNAFLRIISFFEFKTKFFIIADL